MIRLSLAALFAAVLTASTAVAYAATPKRPALEAIATPAISVTAEASPIAVAATDDDDKLAAAASAADMTLAPMPEDLEHDVLTSDLVYDIRPGETVRTAFARWAKLAGWTLVWRSDSDLVTDAAVRFPPRTEFRDAVRETMRAMWARKPNIVAQAYRNQVLVVSDRGDRP